MRSSFSGRVGISLVLVFIACAVPTLSRAGPCTAKITRLRARVDDAIDAHAGAGPFGREGLRATRSWQPTPKSIAHADKRVSGWKGGLRAIRALQRAREADRSGDAETCQKELLAAKRALKSGP